jgi:hypothetical protein
MRTVINWIGKPVMLLGLLGVVAYGLAAWAFAPAASGNPTSQDASTGPANIGLSCNYKISPARVVSDASCSLTLGSGDMAIVHTDIAPSMTGKLTGGSNLTLRGVITSGADTGLVLTVTGKLTSQTLADGGSWSITPK